MTDELLTILRRIVVAKEILGMGGKDCVYRANKELEVAAARLRELINLRPPTRSDP